jgi:TetR/AcrR family transcriptional regulator, transcriptional repressor of bet genes
LARASFVRSAPDVRRQSLIDATARCLAAHGVAGTSVRAICREAGVSPGLLTHYFSGIEALIVATYRETGARVSAAIDAAVAAAGDDARARLEAYITASFLPPVLDPALLSTWLAFWSLVKADPAVAEAHADIYRAYRGGLEALVSDCLGEHCAQADVRLIGVAITALVDGLWLELCLDPTTFTADEARAMAVKWLDTLLSGAA